MDPHAETSKGVLDSYDPDGLGDRMTARALAGRPGPAWPGHAPARPGTGPIPGPVAVDRSATPAPEAADRQPETASRARPPPSSADICLR